MKIKGIFFAFLATLQIWSVAASPHLQSDSCKSDLSFWTLVGFKTFLPVHGGGGMAYDNFSIGIAPCLGFEVGYKKWSMHLRGNAWMYVNAKGSDRYNPQFTGLTNTYYLGVSRTLRIKNKNSMRVGVSHYWFRQNPFVYILPELSVNRGVSFYAAFPFKWAEVELRHYFNYKGIFGLWDRDNLAIYLTYRF